MTAGDAITIINSSRWYLTADECNTLMRLITRAALFNDLKAAHFLWLLQWQPQQLAN